MYVFIGQRKEDNPKKFKTTEGYILTFDKQLPLFNDYRYIILCSRNEDTGIFTFIRSLYEDSLDKKFITDY